MRGRALIMGIGADGADGLNAGYLDIIEDAGVLAGGQRQLAFFPDHPGQRIVIGADVEASVAAIRRAVEHDLNVVVLASGDPLLFGIGTTLIRELGIDRVLIYPAVSSVQWAFASVGEPWHDATILSVHGRPLADILPAALAATKLAILTDGVSTPAAIGRALTKTGMEDCRAVVCERAGPNENVIETTLAALDGQEFDPLNVLLLFRRTADVRLTFGRPDDDFESARGQITKAEVRAVTLSKLRLAPAGVLWDVGAGSGALAIEAGRLMPSGQVCAIERDPEQQACLERNVSRHCASNVRIVRGEAPEAFDGLPWPDSVFLGGSGGRLDALLGAAPRPFVINLAVLEHLDSVLRRFPKSEVTQLNAARGAPIAEGHRLAACNPVYIVSVPA